MIVVERVIRYGVVVWKWKGTMECSKEMIWYESEWLFCDMVVYVGLYGVVKRVVVDRMVYRS